jgi:hypothetical protein
VLTASSGVDNLVDAWQREVVLQAMLVEGREVDAHAEHLSVSPWDEHYLETHVACLISRINLAASSRLTSIPMALRFGSKKLLDWSGIGVDLSSMLGVLGEFAGYSWHVGWTPGKSFPALMEEFEKRAFLYGVQSC